jgi:hypothetical protein
MVLAGANKSHLMDDSVTENIRKGRYDQFRKALSVKNTHLEQLPGWHPVGVWIWDRQHVAEKQPKIGSWQCPWRHQPPIPITWLQSNISPEEQPLTTSQILHSRP